jgi:hypothetical protein
MVLSRDGLILGGTPLILAVATADRVARFLRTAATLRTHHHRQNRELLMEGVVIMVGEEKGVNLPTHHHRLSQLGLRRQVRAGVRSHRLHPKRRLTEDRVQIFLIGSSSLVLIQEKAGVL